MAFVTLCQIDDLFQGESAAFVSEGRPVLLVWPYKGELKAFQGVCPHQDISLEGALLQGDTLTCQVHRWAFDMKTGQGKAPHFFCLERYALRIEAGAVQVDVMAEPVSV
jgi:toluene monooxygenase system ferredoxin subunit